MTPEPPDSEPLHPALLAKEDGSDDALFYRPARLVTHIDEGAVAALTARYAELIPPGSAVLDLMSSWVSHLPEGLPLREVLGQGMNAQELSANPRLTRWWVQDLNREPLLPLPDAGPSSGLDAALCCVGVQYLQRPLEVFADLRRTLAPGGVAVVSFSNRCFPTKAIAAWLSLDMAGRAALVRLYLDRAGFSDVTATVLADGRAGDPLIAVEGRA